MTFLPAAAGAIAASSLAYGRLNRFQVAQMMAHNSVLRDATNPFAYEALGLSLACNGQTDDARACFMKGLGVAGESQPVDTETEERINRQLVWLSEHASTINGIKD
jgi:Flp pilus assembly protein TadD